MVYLLCLILFAIGIYGVLTQRNLIKIIMCLGVTESAINMFLVLLGYRIDGVAPIQGAAQQGADLAAKSVDPLPQAMVLTAIVIEVGVLALAAVIALRLYHRYGTYDVRAIRNLRG